MRPQISLIWGNKMEFCSQEEFKKIIGGDKAVFDEVLTRLHNKTVEVAMLYTPELTAKLIKHSVEMNKRITKFYSDNPEFEQHKDIVQAVATEVEAKNPGKSYDDLLKDIVVEVRKKVQQLPSAQMEIAMPSVEDLNVQL